jgi:hypothetical protein
MARKDVRISFSGRTISVDQKKVQPHVSSNDTVNWTGSLQYTLVLHNKTTGTTSTITSTQQGGNWLASAGPWDSSPQDIKYDVTATDHDPLDPEIEVIP